MALRRNSSSHHSRSIRFNHRSSSTSSSSSSDEGYSPGRERVLRHLRNSSRNGRRSSRVRSRSSTPASTRLEDWFNNPTRATRESPSRNQRASSERRRSSSARHGNRSTSRHHGRSSASRRRWSSSSSSESSSSPSGTNRTSYSKRPSSSDMRSWLNYSTQRRLPKMFQREVNVLRMRNGLRELKLDSGLNEVSARHNYYQAKYLRPGMRSPALSNGMTVKDRLRRIRHRHRLLGEYVVVGPHSSAIALDYLMHQRGFRQAVVDPYASNIGVHGGKDASGKWFWTVIFTG